MQKNVIFLEVARPFPSHFRPFQSICAPPKAKKITVQPFFGKRLRLVDGAGGAQGWKTAAGWLDRPPPREWVFFSKKKERSPPGARAPDPHQLSSGPSPVPGYLDVLHPELLHLDDLRCVGAVHRDLDEVPVTRLGDRSWERRVRRLVSHSSVLRFCRTPPDRGAGKE